MVSMRLFLGNTLEIMSLYAKIPTMYKQKYHKKVDAR